MKPPPILTARRLTKTYRARTALQSVDFHLHQGDTVAVMGPSGAGKTTLLLTLAGIVRPDQGSVSFNGCDLTRLTDAGRAQLRRDAQLMPELTARDNVALALLVRGICPTVAREQATAMLEQVGFRSAAGTRCYDLSGGEAQLVSVARALVGQPDVIFADEPTGALDQASSQKVMELLVSQARSTGAALVVVTHDPNVAKWCGEVIHIEDGAVRSRDCAGHGTSVLAPSQVAATQGVPASPTSNAVPAAPGVPPLPATDVPGAHA